MKWERKNNTYEWNPWYYHAVFRNMEMTLRPPYRTDPWSVKLTVHNTVGGMDVPVYHSEQFRLPNDPESFIPGTDEHPNLEAAKQEAYRLMEEYVRIIAEVWTTRLETVRAMGEES